MNINIIGNGRIALALVKEIVNGTNSKKINCITIYSRKCTGIKDGKYCRWIDPTFEHILNIYLEEKELPVCIYFRYFDSLSQVALLCKNSKKEDLLILAIKYDMNELKFVDKQCQEKFNLQKEEHVKLLSFRLHYFDADTTQYEDEKGIVDKNKLKIRVKKLERQAIYLEETIKRMDKQTSVGYERLYNLRNSAIGILNLGNVIKHFKGMIFNMINEIDITNWILIKVVGISAESLLSPCENDSLRAKYFLRNKLQEFGIEAKSLSLVYIGPHNHNGFVPLESVYLDEIPFKKCVEEFPNLDCRDFLRSVIEEINSFGEKVFIKKGSSDEDTVLCLGKAVNQYISQEETYFRASIYLKELDCCTGLPIICKGNKIHIKNAIFDELSKETQERFFITIREQKLICYGLLDCITKIREEEYE